MELKNINELKDELDYLEKGEMLLRVVYSCFDSYYDFRNFIQKNYKYGFGSISDVSRELDNHFEFDDSE